MDFGPDAPPPQVAAGNAPHGCKRRSLRNRILLYLGGFELAEAASLDLAAECLRRVSPDADPCEAMRVLDDLLCERGLGIRQACSRPPILSIPPLNRKSMLSGRIESFTFYGSAKKLYRRVVKPESARIKT